MSADGRSRPAGPGELCPCGRAAVVVGEDGTGDCGREDGGTRPDGVCVFCGDTVDHAHYAAAERAAGRGDGSAPDPRVRQGGRCPLYRLRLAAPTPAIHPDSVRPFDLAAWRREQTRRRLIAEIAELLLSVGIQEDPTEAAIAGEITVDQLADVASGPEGERAVPPSRSPPSSPTLTTPGSPARPRTPCASSRSAPARRGGTSPRPSSAPAGSWAVSVPSSTTPACSAPSRASPPTEPRPAVPPVPRGPGVRAASGSRTPLPGS